MNHRKIRLIYPMMAAVLGCLAAATSNAAGEEGVA
jgi:hypothetical protein